MPLTAVLQDDRVIDLTTSRAGPSNTDDGEYLPGVSWNDFYKTHPRTKLKCRECGHGLHAKISRTGMRFFAHDAHAPDCGLAGESIAHRLLKTELASAIRRAGWHAELEIAGNGWRADVLASSPDGNRKMAWEAQLAAATADDLQARTARMAMESVAVCWVTDKDRPFVGYVPSIRIEVPGAAVRGPSQYPTVVDGLGAFEPDWCETSESCSSWNRVGQSWTNGPCPGHGRWIRPERVLSLADFVRHVLTGNVVLHTLQTDGLDALDRHKPGPMVWTTEPHLKTESSQLLAMKRSDRYRRIFEQVEQRKREERARHHANSMALLARQEALLAPAVDLIGREAGGVVGIRDATDEWAMGVPLFVHGLSRGVIAPIAGRIDETVRDRMAGLTIFVASAPEQQRIARSTVTGQRIVIFEVEANTDAFEKRLANDQFTRRQNQHPVSRPRSPRGP